jgi:hypothetical protein
MRQLRESGDMKDWKLSLDFYQQLPLEKRPREIVIPDLSRCGADAFFWRLNKSGKYERFFPWLEGACP